MSQSKGPSGRIAALDGLRLLAILGVLLYHSFPLSFPGGFIGVDLFLLLAGFLAMASLVRIPEEQLAAGLWNYGRRRFLRIFLPMLFMLVWVLAFCSLFAPELMLNMRAQTFASLTFFSNLWQIFEGGSYFADFLTPQPFTHLWYLALQLQWLILLPVIYFSCRRLLKKSRLQIAAILLGLAFLSALLMAFFYIPGEDPTRVYYGSDSRAFAFLLGAALYLFRQSGLRFKRKCPRSIAEVWPFLCLGLLVLLALTLDAASAWTYRGGIFLAALASMGLLPSLLKPQRLISRILSHPLLVRLGRASYGFYLWYYPVMTLAGLYPGLRQQLALQWLFIFILGLLSHGLIEESFLRLFLASDRHHGRLRLRSFLRYLGQLPGVLFALLMLAVTTTAVIGLIRAPSGENPTQMEMEAIMEENRALIAEGKSVEQIPPDLSSYLLYYAQGLDIDFVGDSVLLAAAEPIQSSFSAGRVDAEVGRQFSDGVAILEQKATDGQLADQVVLVLGSNGAFRDSDMEALMELLADRQVFLVNSYVPRIWQDEVNEKLWETAKEYPNCYLIDWHTLADQHPEWLYSDHIHTNEEGALAFTALIIRSLYDGRALGSDYFAEFVAMAAQEEHQNSQP